MLNPIRMLADLLEIASEKCNQIADGDLFIGPLGVTLRSRSESRQRTAFDLGREVGPKPPKEEEGDGRPFHLVK